MADEDYPRWPHSDPDLKLPHNRSVNSEQTLVARDSLDSPLPPSKSTSSPPSSTFDKSALQSPASTRPDNVSLERATTISTTMTETNLVEPSFDESILRALCDLDVRRSSYFLSNLIKFMSFYSVACHYF
jgi:hypothetical protein